MTVTWTAKRGLEWPEAAYAVPCPSCNVEIGHPCQSALGTHLPRAERAQALGFVTIADGPLLKIMEAAE
jgi:hypothetical protein